MNAEEKVTKKQLVDFINSRCRDEQGKIPKYVLQKLPKEYLIKIITSDPKIETAFKEYVKNDNERKSSVVRESKKSVKDTVVPSNVSEKDVASAIQELGELVDELVRDPRSFLATIELKEFISELPYGTISHEVLREMIHKLQDVNPGMALVLLEYSANQAVSMQ